MSAPAGPECPWCGCFGRHWNCPLMASWWEQRFPELNPRPLIKSLS